MDSLFWSRMHGGATHFPIAFVLGAALFEILGFTRLGNAGARGFGVTGYWLILAGAISSLGAIFSGLVLSKFQIGGTGALWWHHVFVWPSLALIIGLAVWRVLVADRPSDSAFRIYLGTLITACLLIAVAGFFGGEMLLGH